jgi:hypothetical protein
MRAILGARNHPWHSPFGHQPGSAIKSAQLGLVTRKYAPQKLRLVVELARVFPIEAMIAREAGCQIVRSVMR